MTRRGRRNIRELVRLLVELGAIDVDRRRTLPALIPYLKKLQREGHKVVIATIPNTGRSMIIVDRDIIIPVWTVAREEELLTG